jgi:hypothetical protein
LDNTSATAPHRKSGWIKKMNLKLSFSIFFSILLIFCLFAKDKLKNLAFLSCLPKKINQAHQTKRLREGVKKAQ